MNFEDVGEKQIRPPARALMVNRNDNVALLLGNVRAGEAIMVNGNRIEIASESVPAGYKIATYALEIGASIIAGGQIIGVALRPIRPGEVVHNHNLRVA